MKKNLKGKLIIIVAIIAVLSAAAFLMSTAKASKAKEVYIVKQDEVYNSIITSGSVISPKSVLIKSELVGRIISSDLDEGDIVTKDMVIAQFDDAELSSSLKQAEISLLNAKNQLETIKNKDIKDAKEQVNQSKYEYDNSSVEYERAKKLFESGIPINDSDENLFRAKQNYEKAVSDFEAAKLLFEKQSISKSEYDNYKISVDLALSTLRSAENAKNGTYDDERLNNLKYKKDVAYSRLKSSQTTYDAYLEGGVLYEKAVLNVNQAEAALAKAVEAFNKTVVKAPFDGIIIKKNFNVGDNILAGQDLFYISDIKNTVVKTSIDEKFIGEVKAGQEVLLSMGSQIGESLKGKIQKISPAVDDKTGTIDLTITFDSVPEYIKLNMTVSIEIITGAENGVLVVDKAYYDETNQSVNKIENSKNEIVTIGVKNIQNDKVYVSEGLKEGDILVKPGVFKDNEKVNIGK